MLIQGFQPSFEADRQVVICKARAPKVYCSVLGAHAVHVAMAGYTGIVVGKVDERCWAAGSLGHFHTCKLL